MGVGWPVLTAVLCAAHGRHATYLLLVAERRQLEAVLEQDLCAIKLLVSRLQTRKRCLHRVIRLMLFQFVRALACCQSFKCRALVKIVVTEWIFNLIRVVFIVTTNFYLQPAARRRRRCSCCALRRGICKCVVTLVF